MQWKLTMPPDAGWQKALCPAGLIQCHLSAGQTRKDTTGGEEEDPEAEKNLCRLAHCLLSLAGTKGKLCCCGVAAVILVQGEHAWMRKRDKTADRQNIAERAMKSNSGFYNVKLFFSQTLILQYPLKWWIILSVQEYRSIDLKHFTIPSLHLTEL